MFYVNHWVYLHFSNHVAVGFLHKCDLLKAIYIRNLVFIILEDYKKQLSVHVKVLNEGTRKYTYKHKNV